MAIHKDIHFYTMEVIQLLDKSYIYLTKFYKVEGNIMATGNRVNFVKSRNIFKVTKNLIDNISLDQFSHDWKGIINDLGNSNFKILNMDGTTRDTQNPRRVKSNGRKSSALPIILFIDDLSGNITNR